MLQANKGYIIFLPIILLLFVFAGCSAEGDTESGTVELRLGHFFPSTHPVERELIQPWTEAIEEATDGEVLITSFPGETLLQADNTYENVISGVADMGVSCFSYTRGRFPVMEAFELPGINYNNSKVASMVAWKGIKELKPEELQNTKVLMVFATGPGDLFTKEPVTTLEDLRGMEIRATGLSAKTLGNLGAIPVSMPQSEGYEALSKGNVDGNLSPLEVLHGWRHAEVTDYVTLTPFLYNTLFYMTMNLDTWNSLSEENRRTIEEISEEYFEEVAMELWDRQNETAIDWAKDETGQEIIELSAEESSRWIGLVEPIQEEFIENMNSKGFEGQRIMDLVRDLAAEYNDKYQ